ncbi:MAG: hypothetical protein ACE5HX_10815 [bacterium]
MSDRKLGIFSILKSPFDVAQDKLRDEESLTTNLLLTENLVVRDSSLSRLGGIGQNDNYDVFVQALIKNIVE